MWWLSRNRKSEIGNRKTALPFLISGFCFLISACGFTPLYAQKASTPEDISIADALARVQVVATVNLLNGEFYSGLTRMREQFQNDLADRLNPGGVLGKHAAIYRLAVDMNGSEVPIGISRDGTVSRYNVYLTSTFRLYRTADDALVHSGQIRRVGSYSLIANAYFSTYVSREDSIRRGLTELAEDYRQQLAAFMARNPDPRQLQLKKLEEKDINIPPPPGVDPNRTDINSPFYNEINRSPLR